MGRKGCFSKRSYKQKSLKSTQVGKLETKTSRNQAVQQPDVLKWSEGKGGVEARTKDYDL